MSDRPALTRRGLVDQLRSLGIAPGDLLMVHGSLRKLGLARATFGDGGAELILDALDEAVGPAGTLLMTMGTDYAADWVNLRPPGERAALLAGTAPFRFEDAPVNKEVGWLAEAFRRRPGTLVSANPSGRFGAAGARAAALLADQPWDDYYGPGSPLQKFCEWGGRILRLGAGLDTVTALHYAEYLADLPNKRRTRWDYLLAGENGPEHVWITCLDDSQGIADWDGEDYFAALLTDYFKLGRHREGPVGAVRAELIEAADLVEYGARWMEANLSVPA
jgi:aminoglycoside N3'-acetyltransferase